MADDPLDLETEKAQLLAEGHTRECAAFWCDVLLMDRIGERWDHWTQPSCAACDARRAAKAHTRTQGAKG